ncbi:hypothetical protein F5Y13DRAFT_163888 [Hypoxylon sp. FL1857]|nr:hypothetical protein F5Y13DRAFT_163888 [Hypoxylon sp. FL1857]
MCRIIALSCSALGYLMRPMAPSFCSWTTIISYGCCPTPISVAKRLSMTSPIIGISTRVPVRNLIVRLSIIASALSVLLL